MYLTSLVIILKQIIKLESWDKMNLNEVAGIVITSDGVAHPFGRSDEAIGGQNEISHEEYFSKEIASKDWFKALGIEYDSQNLYYQIPDMTKYGLSFVINGSSVSNNERDVYAYCIFVPDEMSLETKEYFSKNYEELKNLLEKDQAFFQADSFHNGEYINKSPFDSLDEFYTAMNISTESYRR